MEHHPFQTSSIRIFDNYKNKSRNYLYEGNLDMMEVCIDIQEAIMPSGDPILKGDIQNQKGIIEYYRNNSNEALGYYLKALDYYSMSDYHGGINTIMNNIAIIFNHIEDYESTRKYLVKALESTPENDINSRSIYLLNLAETESKLNNCQVGVNIARELLEVYNPEEIFFSELWIYGVLVLCYNEMGMKKEAAEWIEKGISTFNEDITYIDRLAFYGHAIKYFFDLDNYEKVLELGEKIYPPQDTTFIRDMYEPINHMAIAALETGNTALAIELDKVANRIEYSKETLDRVDLITPLMLEYSSKRNNANRELARLELSENNKTEKAQRYILASMILIMLAMIIFIPFMVRIRRLRKKLQAELAEKNKSLEEINWQLESDNRELEKGNNMLDTFISVFAHDLINPFQAIIGFSQLMTTDHEVLSKEDFIEYSELLSDTSFQLNQLLTNLKSLSISQEKPEQLKSGRIEVSEIVNRVIKLFETSARKKNISFELQDSIKDCAGLINNDVLESAIRNIISNAVKFSKNDGRIEIGCIKDKEHIQLSIKDYGIGMPEDVLRDLFQKKYAQSKAGTANEKGSGIGLAISMELLESFKGALKFNSKKGEGTEVIIVIPAWNE